MNFLIYLTMYVCYDFNIDCFLYNDINQICERHYPNVEVELKKPKQETVEQEEPSRDENNNDNDNDIKKELEKELNELSNVTKNDRTGQIKRFVNHNTDTQCRKYRRHFYNYIFY